MPEKGMAKGISVKFKSYEGTIPQLLRVINLQKELKKYESIVLKVRLTESPEQSTSAEFIESVLSFVLQNKNPVANVFIAEGSDGQDTEELFETRGLQNLADKYGVGLIDLNTTETEPIESYHFQKFQTIYYPLILSKSFVITLTNLTENPETGLGGSISSMLGAFPAKHYQGFFSSNKNKIRKFPIKYSIHDIIRCKMPDFAIVDASEFGHILAGIPLEIDKQSCRFIKREWKEVPYIKLINEVLEEKRKSDEIEHILQ